MRTLQARGRGSGKWMYLLYRSGHAAGEFNGVVGTGVRDGQVKDISGSGVCDIGSVVSDVGCKLSEIVSRERKGRGKW